MYYVTWSEGFRPGLLNRPVGATNPDGTYSVKAEVDTDEVTNYEFGWKTVLRDGQLRFNGSAFMVDISGLQSTYLIQVLLICSSLIMQQMLKLEELKETLFTILIETDL